MSWESVWWRREAAARARNFMCGFAGYLSRSSEVPDALSRTATRMSAALIHRGPDDAGVWCDAAAGISFGFRRLSIIDLSLEGHQPMHSPSGRYVIVFNGEIYNFASLRAELEAKGHGFRGHSDTEILLASIEEWGLDTAVGKFNGMFAFALWDRAERRLHLVRDRAGEKPLYYGWISPRVFAFGSELKALQAHPSFDAEIDRAALGLYLRYGYVPAPYCIFEGIHKVLPGTIVSLDADSSSVADRAYWSMRDVVAQDRVKVRSTEECVEELDDLLSDAVKLRMIADVPLGAFLSGGIDSSTVVAAMQRQSGSRVRTFTIGFESSFYDEAAYAANVARHLGTDHTELYVSPHDAKSVIPLLPTIYDEPYSDSSQIPTYLVSRLARQQVTVALSGDGGDELFGGYSRYARAGHVWRSLSRAPRFLKRTAASLTAILSDESWDALLSGEGNVSRALVSRGVTADRVAKLRDMLRMDDPRAVCRDMVTHWRDAGRLAGTEDNPVGAFTDREVPLTRFAEISMYLDSVTYLPDDILVKLDRATMAVSLEGRVPLLDHRIIEFAWRLPLELKIRDGVGKWILRQVLDKYVPKDLVERPKKGFGVPIDVWLREDLREWAESYLNEDRLREDGIFDPPVVLRKWRQHLAGVCNWKPQLWDVLMFQTWRQEQQRRKSTNYAEPSRQTLTTVPVRESW